MIPTDRPLPAAPVPLRRERTVLRRFVTVVGWVCLAAALGAWGLLRAGDVWAPATAAMFAPLPLLVLPPAVFLVVAAVVRRRALRTLVPAVLVAAGPVAGFCLPWARFRASESVGPPLRVLTCNMHYAKVPARPLDRLIDEAAPDVVALQEWRDGSRLEALAGPGWHVHREPGQFLASRYPIRRADRLGSHSTDPGGSVGRYELDTPTGVVTVFSVHFASPRDGLAEVARGDADGLAGLAANSGLRRVQSRRLAAEAGRANGPVLLLGDFNTPPQSAIFRDVWGGYTDAFASAGWGWGRTFSARLSAVRIDYVLVGGGGRALRCRAGPDVGSPHRPVLADVAWPETAPPRRP